MNIWPILSSRNSQSTNLWIVQVNWGVGEFLLDFCIHDIYTGNQRGHLEFSERIPMKKKVISKLNSDWIIQTRDYFREFLELSEFPHPVRNGARGSRFTYPEWMIMFIAVLSVKCKIKSYVGIHQLSKRYWDLIAEGTSLKPISERQLRDRLKKISHSPGSPATFIFQVFSAKDLA